MTLSLSLAAIWVLCASLAVVFPGVLQSRGYPNVPVALGIPILGLVTWQHGPWVGLAVLAAGTFILRWSVRYLRRRTQHDPLN